MSCFLAVRPLSSICTITEKNHQASCLVRSLLLNIWSFKNLLLEANQHSLSFAFCCFHMDNRTWLGLTLDRLRITVVFTDLSHFFLLSSCNTIVYKSVPDFDSMSRIVICSNRLPGFGPTIIILLCMHPLCLPCYLSSDGNSAESQGEPYDLHCAFLSSPCVYQNVLSHWLPFTLHQIAPTRECLCFSRITEPRPKPFHNRTSPLEHIRTTNSFRPLQSPSSDAMQRLSLENEESSTLDCTHSATLTILQALLSLPVQKLGITAVLCSNRLPSSG